MSNFLLFIYSEEAYPDCVIHVPFVAGTLTEVVDLATSGTRPLVPNMVISPFAGP